MSLILKEDITEILLQHRFFKGLFETVRRHKILTRVCSVCLVGMLAVGVTIVSVGLTLGFKVNYAGSFIATVKNMGVFDDAKTIAMNNIKSENADMIIEQPRFKMTLAVSNRLDSAFRLADAIIENTNDITEAAALTVNGETVLCADAAAIKAGLKARLARFNAEGAENRAEFTDSVKLENGYYLKSELADQAELEAAAERLNVKTISVLSTDTQIPFAEKTVKDSNQLIGYSKVTTVGEYGISRKTERVEYLNGTEIGRSELSSETVKEPVTQVTVVGTAKTTASPAQRSAERNAGFICPLKRGTFTVTTYFGNGHRGVDLATDKGSSIYAVSPGTVISAEFDHTYGNCVVIDHGNGLYTRYAHASAICVSKGDTVKQGDVIAYVGSTGNSTGNHLHFEVLTDLKTRVNPVSYIGLD